MENLSGFDSLNHIIFLNIELRMLSYKHDPIPNLKSIGTVKVKFTSL